MQLGLRVSATIVNTTGDQLGMSITIRPHPANLILGGHHTPDAEDSSFSHPKAAELAARGLVVAVGYGALGSPSKWTTPDEIRALFAAGIAYIGCGELGATSWRGGAPTGRLHAAQFNAYYASIGYPHDCPIPVAFDSNIEPADMATAIAYGLAVADDLHWPFGVYGAKPIINALAYRSSFNWLNAATSWNHGQQLAAGVVIHMIQSGGDATIGIDYDVIAAPFKAWLGANVDATLPPPTALPPPTTPPAPSPIDPKDSDDMLRLIGGESAHSDPADPLYRGEALIVGGRFRDAINPDHLVELRRFLGDAMPPLEELNAHTWDVLRDLFADPKVDMGALVSAIVAVLPAETPIDVSAIEAAIITAIPSHFTVTTTSTIIPAAGA